MTTRGQGLDRSHRRLAVSLLAVVLALVLGAPAPGEAWWDQKWRARKQITFDTTPMGAEVGETLNDVPVLIRLHMGNFSFSEVNQDGSDIRFVSGDDKVLLKFHMELFDPVNDIALFWVRVPRLAGSDNQGFIWMYYGNSAASPAQNPGGTYDVPQLLVYHLAEESGVPQDQTAYGNHAVQAGTGHGLPAVIGKGYSFRGAEDRLVIPRAPALDFSGGFTFSAWVRLAEAVPEARLVSWESGDQGLVIALNRTRPAVLLTSGASQTTAIEATTEMAMETWHHLAVTAEPSKRLILYLDGRESASAPLTGTLPQPTADFVIGAAADGRQGFHGDLDEIQLARTARSEGWLRLGYQGQGPDAAYLAVGEEETGTAGEVNLTFHLIRVVARTITLDGWIVIGILAIMSALSWMVFFYKTYILHLCRRNDQKVDQAMKTDSCPVAVYKGLEHLEHAPLYQVLAAGCEALNGVAPGTGLRAVSAPTAPSLSSVRSAMEKAAMKESRRLGGGLMILTMSISGGPFLGLLGTVWGVMNTFASMAEAGEANLNAIAPGVASALACTLGGLVVAIPALFAYGYLSAGMKDLIADMHVFIDEVGLRLSVTTEGEGP